MVVLLDPYNPRQAKVLVYTLTMHKIKKKQIKTEYSFYIIELYVQNHLISNKHLM